MKTEFAVSKRMTAFVFAAIVFLFIAAAICFFFFDGYVIRWFYQVGINWDSGRAVKIFQYLGKTWLLAWLILFWGIVTRRNQPITIALLTFLAVGAIVLPLKLLVHRERPGDFIERVYEQKDEDQPPALLRSWSFPSGDTANVFAIATVLLPFIRLRLAIVFLIVSSCVGILRVLVFAHYPSDVFAGAAAGMFAGWLILTIFQRRPLSTWIGSRQFFVAQIIAFIIIPCFFAVSKFRVFIDIMCTFGVLLALILIAFLLQRKYSFFGGKQR